MDLDVAGSNPVTRPISPPDPDISRCPATVSEQRVALCLKGRREQRQPRGGDNAAAGRRDQIQGRAATRGAGASLNAVSFKAIRRA